MASTMDDKLTRVFSRTPSSWDPQDDLLLRHLKEQQRLGWKEIASHFAHRTPNACQFRWRRLRSGALKGGTAATPSASGSASATATASPAVHDKSTSPSTSPLHSPQGSSTGSSVEEGDAENTAERVARPEQQQQQQQRHHHHNIHHQHLLHLQQELTSPEKPQSTAAWTTEEDGLLLARRSRALSFAELSILLPQRSEPAIHRRLSMLEASNPREVYLSPTPRQRRSSTATPRKRSSFSQTVTQDAARTRSLSYSAPPLFSAFPLRRGSISYVRRNSVLRENAVSDDEDEQHQLPPLKGALFNYFSKT